MITKSPIALQKEIKVIYNKEAELFKNDNFMGKVTGINIETKGETTTLQILTEKGSLHSWTVNYDKYELNQLERYLFTEIPLFKDGAVIKEMEILERPFYQ